jgi:hypothetical protein
MNQILGKSILNKLVLHRHLRIVAAHGTPPIDPFKKHGQLCGSQSHCSARDLWPNEFSSLKSFREKTQAIAVHETRTHALKTDSP